MTKILRKVSTLVLLCVLILGCVFIPVIIRVSDYFIGITGDEYVTSAEDDRNIVVAQIKRIETELENIGTDGSPNQRRIELLDSKAESEFELERLNLLIASGYTDQTVVDFVVEAIGTLPQYRRTIRELEKIPSDLRSVEQDEYLSFCKESIDRIYAFPQNHDFESFVSMHKEKLRYDLSSIQGDRDRLFEVLSSKMDLMYKADPSGGTDGTVDYGHLRESLDYVTELKDSSNSGYSYVYDFSGERLVPLSPKEQKNLSDQIAIEEHKVISGVFVNKDNSVMAGLSNFFSVSFGKFIIAVMIIVLAGSAVSQEIATGSIKSLIIAPVRRWKIFTAKILSLLSIMVGSLLILSFLYRLMSLVVFGPDSMGDYMYINNGNVATLPYFVYSFLSVLIGSVDLFVFLLFAFMLSTVLRNTALSVALSLASYLFTGNIAQLFALLGIRKRWMDFVPFLNFDLHSDLFPFADNMLPDMIRQMQMATTASYRPGLLFSSVYLLVLTFCLIYISFDSFTRRDIK